MTALSLQPIVWRGLAFDVPAEWEIARHSVRPEIGSIHFIDRRHHRLQLGWHECRVEPDCPRLLRDALSKELPDPPSSGSQAVDHDGWTAARLARSDGLTLTRAIRYEPKLTLLIELAFIWPASQEPDPHFERTLLHSIRPGPPGRWCAFGLDARAPADWTVQRAISEPGLATFVFARGRSEAFIRRLSGAGLWLDDDDALVSFLQKRVGGPVTPTRHGPFPAVEAEGPEARSRWERFWGKNRLRRDLAWHDAARNTVFHQTTLTAPDDELGPAAFQARACPQ